MKLKFFLTSPTTIILGLLFGFVNPAVAQRPVAILYDNDVHCHIDGYRTLAWLKDSLTRQGSTVWTVSSGDYVSGAPEGVFDQGRSIITLMNAVGYDCVTFGNHEFDYSIDMLQEHVRLTKAHPVCCNFKPLPCKRSTMETADYFILGDGLQKTAFVGVTTPDSPTSSTPAHFQDDDGCWCYHFGGDSVALMVQRAVDNARKEGARFVVLLSHLGDESDGAITSTELIALTRGIDVVLDGHAHNTIAHRFVRNADGDGVLLSSTGSHFRNIGLLTLYEDGGVATSLYDTKRLSSMEHLLPGGTADSVARVITRIRDRYDAIGKREIGYNEKAMLSMDNDDRRICRMGECTLGNLCADALRHASGADVAVVNGGGIRSDLPAGTLRYNDIYAVLPFESDIYVATVNGQSLLDALEWAYSKAPEEAGSFLQVSGMRIELDLSIPAQVSHDANGIFLRVEGPRRVKKVEIYNSQTKEYEPIDPERNYRMAGSSYVLLQQGDGNRFEGMVTDDTPVGKDTDILERYIQYLGGRIPADYELDKQRIIIRDF